MTGKERVLATLNHQKTDRVPWIPFTGVHAGALKGYSATEVLTDSQKLYESLMEAYKLYQPDALPVVFDLQIEAEILGCKLVWADEAPPSVADHPLEETTDLPCECLMPTRESGRIPFVLDVMSKMKASVGDDIALYGLICGPFTLASHLRGNNLFMDMILDEDYVHKLMEFTTTVSLKMVDLYLEAGMDVIAVVDPLVSQISPEHFTELCHESFKTVYDYIRAKGAKSSFFVCGNATRQLEVMCKTGPDSISIDENVDMKSAKEITDSYNIAIGGNIPLTTLMLHGTQQENMKFVVNMLDTLSHDNLIIAPGCDMPYAVPADNSIGIAQAILETDAVREMVKNYEAPKEDIHVELPDYASLERPLVEAFTLDSATCAACTYMMGAMNVAKEHFGDRIDLVEYKFTEKENIARCVKMGVKNLPCVYVNGELKWSSIIPSREELFKTIEGLL
ncbi:uroporphyrinogen decarboxylase family protein [Anaerotalea alkaliphila]|uniref:Uroporphyrinogen decarboxylase n=1 Tax=Anaerotalea alkaliphila TaxID=2662126 RepID=A0A7X5HTM1_9FIRM|nr:uroporphyrinogen decarboxylase family protein [Anaerotalea alkaliphila]NDL66455.1 uroporphyrinogen decarboxylase [Anaerotalea alkaliphila]